ncbi:MAG: group II intron maturase-specific domain-containing protein [Candidatus Sedimenticola sp. (ex Thyasira tokunagai)]
MDVPFCITKSKTRLNFTPAISNKAAKAIRQKSCNWNWQQRSDKELEDFAEMFNPVIQGWINYYSRYCSALYSTSKMS